MNKRLIFIGFALIWTFICGIDGLVAAQNTSSGDEKEQPIISSWDLPREVSAHINEEKYARMYEGEFWPIVGFKNLDGNLEAALLKSDVSTNFLIKNPDNEDFELGDFSYMVGDSVGYFVIWGDSCKEGSSITFLKPNLYVRDLIIYGMSDCDLNLVGKFESVTLINCKNISLGNEIIDALYSTNNLVISQRLQFVNCSFANNFNVKLDDGGGKIQFDECQFAIDEFRLAIPDSTQLVFSDCPLTGIKKITPSWKKLSQWLIPKDFLFWEIRQIDSLGERFCLGYDPCLSAEGNKLAWTENHKIVLHQFQEFYQQHYQFDKGDSVFRTLKDLETETYRHDLENAGSQTRFKSSIHFYFMSFMGWFCGYGTEPIMALYNAGLLIFVFAFLYILFPTRFNDRVPLAEDGFFFLGLRIFAGEETEIDRLLLAYREYIAHNPNASIWKFYYHRRRRLLASYRRKLPSGLSFYIDAATPSNRLGQILIATYLKAATLPYLSHLFLISLVEKQTRSHLTGLKAGHKPSLKQVLKGKNLLFLSFALMLILLSRIPVGLLVSVNAFSTLGFGHLPLRGITKYIAILEGLVGWFTLTLFSITYVNILLR